VRGAKLLALRGTETAEHVEQELATLDVRGRPQHILLCDAGAQHGAALQCAPPGSVLATCGSVGPLDLADLSKRELSVVGLTYGHPDLMPESAALVAKGEIELASFMREMPIAEAKPADVLAARTEGQCLVLPHAFYDSAKTLR
jgi:hypothetical protein